MISVSLADAIFPTNAALGPVERSGSRPSQFAGYINALSDISIKIFFESCNMNRTFFF